MHGGEEKKGVDAETLGKICDQVKNMVDLGVEVAIVVGGGNFWRGRYKINTEFIGNILPDVYK